MKFFVGDNGVIYTVYANGTSNLTYGANSIVKDNTISILDSCGMVIDEYTLWNSLVDLANAIENLR